MGLEHECMTRCGVRVGLAKRAQTASAHAFSSRLRFLPFIPHLTRDNIRHKILNSAPYVHPSSRVAPDGHETPI